MKGQIARGASPQAQGTQLGVRETPGSFPVPDGDLILLVAGGPDVAWFLEGGFRAAQSIINILKKHRQAVGGFESILDFGCGCGRVLRYWRTLKHTKVFGTDCNPRLIDWCKQNLDFAECAVNNLLPPLSYDDSAFDFIYALSVFTHLPEALQLPWINELARVLRPDGFLLITTHGKHYCRELTPDQVKRFRRGELVVRNEEFAGTNTCGAFHPERYVRRTLARDFKVIDFIAEGAQGNPYQDVYLLRKKPVR